MLPHESHEMPSHDGPPHRKHEWMKPHEEIMELLKAIYGKVQHTEEKVRKIEEEIMRRG
ncbi:hypothetical protein HYV82_03665 [Candidatus Woesearchaeota archaeon]|nr:hypothetical protein [Candidatus Woesearchaeota archaeon]